MNTVCRRTQRQRAAVTSHDAKMLTPVFSEQAECLIPRKRWGDEVAEVRLRIVRPPVGHRRAGSGDEHVLPVTLERAGLGQRGPGDLSRRAARSPWGAIDRWAKRWVARLFHQATILTLTPLCRFRHLPRYNVHDFFVLGCVTNLQY